MKTWLCSSAASLSHFGTNRDYCHRETRTEQGTLKFGSTSELSLYQIQTMIASPRFKVSLNCPSKLTDALHRLSIETSMCRTVLSGNNICLNESVCGQIGVIKRPGVSGWTIDPPADMEYAVDPVGVAIISPSACTVVMRSVSM